MEQQRLLMPEAIKPEAVERAIVDLMEGLEKPPDMSEGFFQLLSSCYDDMLKEVIPTQLRLIERVLRAYFEGILDNP